MTTISQFRSELAGGGARPSQFKVSLLFPTTLVNNASLATNKAQFMVKGASLPASNLGSIDVPFRGRMIKVAGERVFQNWTVTILNDNDFIIRDALEQWSNLILNHTQTNGIVAPTAYTSDLFVDQLDRNDNTLKSYKFINCFPVNISEIGLDFGNNQQIEEYQVEFSVDYWTAISANGNITT